MAELASLKALVRGRVQGVYFRAFTQRHAAELGITGYVRNMPDGLTVEVIAEGNRTDLEQLLSHLKAGPPGSRVENVSVEWAGYSANYREFEIQY